MMTRKRTDIKNMQLPDYSFYQINNPPELKQITQKRATGEALIIQRMLIPIARAGVQIDAFDSSPDMLSILCNQLKGEAPEVRDRVLP